MPDIANHFFPPILKAVQARAELRGKMFVIADIDEHAADEMLRARMLNSRVDGLVIVSPRSTDDHLHGIASLLPVVFVHRLVDSEANVIMDDGAGIDAAVEHLAALGHKRIGHLNGPNAPGRTAVGRTQSGRRAQTVTWSWSSLAHSSRRWRPESGWRI